jgi:phosphatidylethanolamine-binding protein (PEBP) family uncharacterized protein
MLENINASIEVSSAAFGDNEPIPEQYTADGDGLSPPLEWHGVPMSAEAVVILIEDVDGSTVRAIEWDLPGSDAALPEGALSSSCWLPPDPPAGRGPHRYEFQVLALDTVLRFESRPGLSELLDKINGHVIAKGVLTGTYERK